MRLRYNDTKRGRCYYIIRSVYKNGKNTTENVENLGYEDDIREKYHCDDALVWIQSHLDELNEKEREEKKIKVLVPYDPNTLIKKDEAQSFNIGYLFLQQIYYDLRLDLICSRISAQYHFTYDLNAILSRLIYGRILFPGSKLSTWKSSKDLLEQPGFEYHHVVRALSVLAKEFDRIQADLYKNSELVVERKTGVLYYDCTNFYFETEEEDPISNEEADKDDVAARKYGFSKQHQPSPLVQMGLFMDYSGIPLAICIGRGNKNEQLTMKPLEEKILQDYELSKFVVCTDAGLSSDANRKFNNFGERSFVTTVSIKMMDAKTAEWCLEATGWHLTGSNEEFDITRLEDTAEDHDKNYDRIFYKEKYIEGYDDERDIDFNQTLIVTYSLKYRDFLKHKREAQLDRAQKAIDAGEAKVEKKNANDYRRFIKRRATDKKGTDVKINYSIDTEEVEEEQKYDGYYAVITNLDEDAETLLKIVHGRWEIEESFRIMKEDFHSRPVYLSRSEKIRAHFLTCFIALLVYRILERKLGGAYTCEAILSAIRSMRVTKAKEIGYVPSYTRTDLTDALHKAAEFRTDYEIMREKAMKGIIRKSKQRQHVKKKGKSSLAEKQE